MVEAMFELTLPSYTVWFRFCHPPVPVLLHKVNNHIKSRRSEGISRNNA